MISLDFIIDQLNLQLNRYNVYYNINVLQERDQIEQCKELRRDLVGVFKREPGKYYAAIALDADNMGEINRKVESQDRHAENSRQLISYSKKARQIVEEKHFGKLTYAGGDDLLALANLNDLLPMLKGLREEFPCFTGASAGVCIAHNKMPLNNVIRHARRMEKEAKKEDGKDALGIALFKHSGNISEMVTKWNPKLCLHFVIGYKYCCEIDESEIPNT